MNKNIQNLAAKAGFPFWEDGETWNRGNSLIDWGGLCDSFDSELNTFAELMILEVCDIIRKDDAHGTWIALKLMKHYGLVR